MVQNIHSKWNFHMLNRFLGVCKLRQCDISNLIVSSLETTALQFVETLNFALSYFFCIEAESKVYWGQNH